MKSRTYTLRDSMGVMERVLLGPLRDHADDPAIKRVEEILTLLVTADRLLRERADFYRLFDSDLVGPEFLSLLKETQAKKWESERAYYQTLEVLNIKLSRYRWEARLEGDLHAFRSNIVPAVHAGNIGEYSGRSDFDYTELREYSEYTEPFLALRDQLLAQAERPDLAAMTLGSSWEGWEPFLVRFLLEEVDRGEISRLRRCSECQQWFYAIRGHQIFCGDICRRKHEAQSPAFKEKRARYMRETYRPDQKRKEQRAKRQAGFSEKSKKGAKRNAEG